MDSTDEPERPSEIVADRGVLYLSIGVAYSRFTTASIAALRATGYRGRVRVVTDDTSFGSEGGPLANIERIVVPPVGVGYASRHYKTALVQYAYDECLFLDSDTLPVADPSEAWRFLQSADFYLSLDGTATVDQALERPAIDREERELMKHLGLATEPHLNSGVLLFRKSPAVAQLFARWHLEWSRFRNCDQLALVRAIAAARSHIGLLPREWNCPPAGFSTASEARMSGVKVLHFFFEHRCHWPEFAREYESACS